MRSVFTGWRFLVLVDPWPDDLENSPAILRVEAPAFPEYDVGTTNRFGGGYGDGPGFTPTEDMVLEE